MNSSIEKINKVYLHPNADKLELVQVLGYQCVVPKGIYKENDIIIFIKPDSVLPNEEWSIPFLQYASKRVKAIKLRNEWSEGIIVNPLLFNNISLEIGTNVDDITHVTHYEPCITNDLLIKTSYLPFDICKTDEERFENIIKYIPFGEECDVTLKIDGQSCSYYYNVETDTFGVLSRSMELKEDNLNKYTYHINKSFDKDKFINYCKKNNVSLCIRGESYGKGIQKSSYNPYSNKNNRIAFYSCWSIKDRRYIRKGEPHYYLNVCKELGFDTVPMLFENVIITKEMLKYYSTENTHLDLSKFGFSNHEMFEGVVIKHKKGSFKIINKYYDSKK